MREIKSRKNEAKYRMMTSQALPSSDFSNVDVRIKTEKKHKNLQISKNEIRLMG